MNEPILQPKRVRMPELVQGEWLNTAVPLTKAALRGRVVLIDFWDYTCVNCLRTLPYLTAWHGRYAELGLTIIGIHAPEFAFARTQTHVAQAVADHAIRYPVLFDNGYQNWEQFANRAWPTKYLVDADGYIRYQQQGEGYYQETERAIQRLLRERDLSVPLPDVLPLLRAEDAPGAVCYRPTPELYAGYQGGGLFGGGLGNPSGYLPDKTLLYALPEQREPGHFYVEGMWRAWPEAMAFAGQNGGQVVVPYTAVTLNAVLAPSADAVELTLGLRPTEAEPLLTVRQDGRFLDGHNAGSDVFFDENGRSLVRVTQPRMYQLVDNGAYGRYELSLECHATGLAFFAFTFTTCVTPG